MITYYVENATLASKKFEDLTIQSVLEDWIADRKLPRKKKLFKSKFIK